MRYRLVVAALTAMLLAACSDPRVDTSTDETTKASIEKVRQSLPEDKRAEFDQALQTVALSQLDLKTLMAEGAGAAGTTTSKMKQAIGGKSASEIIAAAKTIEAERKERERAQALAEIKELEEKRARAEQGRAALAKFEVTRSRFFKQKRQFLGSEPIIELTVKNGTGHAISRAYFVGTLASPGRSVPWLKDTFNYSISGGLEPGEEATWRLAPNMFSDWGTVAAPADAIFTVEVEQLDGANKETLFSTKEFSARDAERLEKLKKEYGVTG